MEAAGALKAPALAYSVDGGPPRLFALSEPVTTVGRSVDNVLEIPDPNMSRRHCVIEQRDTGEWVLTDCNSSNGTKVNGERVVSQELRPGDEIECGSTRIRFGSHEELAATAGASSRRSTASLSGPSPPPAPEATTTALGDGGSAAAFVAGAPVIAPGGAPGEGSGIPPRRSPSGTFLDADQLRKVGRTRRAEAAVLAHERDDLRKLLEITKRLNQVHDLRRLLEMIIDAAIELMAAERGFLILLSESGQMKIEIARNMDQTSISDAALQVSTQVCREVIDRGEAVLTTDARADSHFGRYQSVVGLNLRSILCVPFRIRGETFGTVYLDAAQVGAFSARDVELLSAFSDQAALAIENARLLHHARQRERLDQELKIASQIQRKLLPHGVPAIPGLELYGWMYAAKEVGGDYYDFVLDPSGKSLFFCVGDVSGKGVPAGLVMASARSALRSLVERGTRSTLEIVLSLNRLLCSDLDQEMFLSFVLMRYDAPSGEIQFCGAGHENLLIWRHARQDIEVQKTGGMVLGLTTRAEEQFVERRLDLAPGDGLVLYTDGVTEALNEQREQFTLERLVETARRHAHQSPKPALHAVLGDVLRFKGRATQRDDITLLVVKRTLPGDAEDEQTRLGVRRS
mgnify:CR=1 FL=1